MRPTATISAGLILLLAFVSAAAFAEAPPDANPGETAAAAETQAALAYDQGRCAQVLGIFEALDEEAARRIGGVSHYRWGFCLAALGKGSPVEHYSESARKLAVEAQQKGAPVDAHFYRVNALINLDRRPEAREAAEYAVARWEAGELTVLENDGRAWFRLGKLHRDAGKPKGGGPPFARALELHVAGTTSLGEPYLQRIADGARAAGNDEVALKALAELEKLRPADPNTALRQARTLIVGGDLDGAKKLVQAARAGRGDTAMLAQYTYYSIVRMQELAKWDLLPAENLADGTPIVEANLRAELQRSARDAFRAMQSEAIEVPRKKNKNKTRLAATPEVRNTMRTVQAEFSGLLREAILQGAPLREWAIADGYAPLIHHPWKKLFREQAAKRRAEQSEQSDQSDQEEQETRPSGEGEPS